VIKALFSRDTAELKVSAEYRRTQENQAHRHALLEFSAETLLKFAVPIALIETEIFSAEQLLKFQFVHHLNF